MLQTILWKEVLPNIKLVMAIISKKKVIFKIQPVLKNYLASQEREVKLPISFRELMEYEESIPLTNSATDEVQWDEIVYDEKAKVTLYEKLIRVYAFLKADGDTSVMQNLYVDRVDNFIIGETKPFRIRVVNKINENFDYFYIKKADASRIYGLEFEHFLSPNRVHYLVDKETVVEEHIAGIPGDTFIQDHLKDSSLNKIRLLKEFIKFNERCFVRLLGDMHPGNFVVDLTPDFEEIHYRIKAIDFDQQAYEGKKSIYLPQDYKRNQPFLEIDHHSINPASVNQYKQEERSLIAKRIRTSYNQVKKLSEVMVKDTISFPENVSLLKEQLSDHYRDKEFLTCKNMGEVMIISLKQLFKKK